MAGWRNRFDGDLALRGPFGREVLAAIPARRGVFLLEGSAGEPILLVTAADIRARMRFRLAPPDEKHSRRVDLRKVASRLRWKLADSHFETDWRFLELARAVYPRTYKGLLSIRPAWFVHVNPREAYPTFRRRRDVGSGAGRYFGPFPDRQSPGRFIEILRDVFNLCRREQLLRRGDPAGCVYAQMGRCSAPCRGGVSMAEYRVIVADACRCAEDGPGPVRRALEEEMRRLSAERLYEQAGNCKFRLDRLGELDGPDFRYVAAAGRFRYVLVQRGPTPQKAKVFFVDRGAIRAGAALEYPLRPKQLVARLSAMRNFCAASRTFGPADVERIALVSHYLFVKADRRGVVVRYDDRLDVEGLARQIASAADVLKLRPPRRGPAGVKARRQRPAGDGRPERV